MAYIMVVFPLLYRDNHVHIMYLKFGNCFLIIFMLTWGEMKQKTHNLEMTSVLGKVFFSERERLGSEP